MTTLQVLLHVAAQRDYELHSLDISTTFLQGSLHEEIWLRGPPGFTGSFPAGTQWSLQRPVYGLHKVPREWHDTLRTILAALGFAPSTADPLLFLHTDTSLPPFYVLVYVNDLVFASADTQALTLVKSEMQKRHTCTDLGEHRSYLGLQITRDRARRTITLTQSHMVHQVLQRFGFQFSSPQPTPLSTGQFLSAPSSDESVEPSGPYPELVGCLISSCEAKIYVGAMATQELRWLTYLLTNLGEQPRSPPVLYVDNKAMISLCQEHRLEHRTKHTALRYFLARELQQRGQLRLAYVATRANTADVFSKALPPSDHQLFSTVLGLITRDRAWRTITLTQSHMVHEVLQCFGFQFSSPQPTLLSTSHSLSAPPSDESIEPSGPYPELVGCLITSGMGLVLGGWVQYSSPVTQTLPGSSCEAEFYAGAMAAQELRWLTYLLTDLGEHPRWPPVLYVDNKAMIALCQEHRLEHRTKHIALRYFLARELQQRGQLRLTYVATRANTGDIFIKALPPGDNQCFSTVLGLLAFLFLTGLVTTCSPPLCLWGKNKHVGTSASGTGARRQETLSPERLHEWAVKWGSPGGGASRARAGGTRTGGTGGIGAGGAGAAGAGGAGAGGTGGAGAGGTGGTRGAGATGAADGTGTALRRLLLYSQSQSSLPTPDSALHQVLSLPSSTGLTPPLLRPLPDQSQSQLLPGSPLLAPSPYLAQKGSLVDRREPESHPASPVRTVCRARPPPVPDMHTMTLRPSSVPQHVALPSPLASSFPYVPDPESDLARTASPMVTRLLATVVTDPSFESTAAFSLVTALVDFAATCCLDYVFELECLATILPHFASMLLCPEGDLDALEIPTRALMQRQSRVLPPGANIVYGMWIFRVKRPPGSPPAFKARYVA
ncbi:unnamed protein product [Closterium sp. NIES-53]